MNKLVEYNIGYKMIDILLTQPCSFSQLGNRDSQEDSFCPAVSDEQTSFFVVCDGVGGREHGEVASQLVCQTIEGLLADGDCSTLTAEDVLSLVEESYTTLYNNRAINSNMATTLALMVKTDSGMLLAHLGDTRIYQVRKDKGVIFCTKDHSLVHDLLDSGQITPEKAKNHPQRHVITKCIFVTGNREDYQIPSITLIRDILPHDIFMLCTDGVYTKLGDKTISEILSADGALKDKVREMATLCRNSCDNNTAYLVEIADVKGEEQGKNNVMYEIKSTKKSICCKILDFVRKTIGFVRET